MKRVVRSALRGLGGLAVRLFLTRTVQGGWLLLHRQDWQQVGRRPAGFREALFN